MTTLYELTGQFLALSQLIDDPDLPSTAFADSLEGLEGEIQVKAEALLGVVASMNGDIESIKAEIDRLNRRKKSIENKKEGLREYLRSNMIATGISKISCPLFDITLSKPRPMVVVEDDNIVPDEYIKRTVTKKVNKQRVLVALKKGETIPGCKLGESAQSLIIR